MAFDKAETEKLTEVHTMVKQLVGWMKEHKAEHVEQRAVCAQHTEKIVELETESKVVKALAKHEKTSSGKVFELVKTVTLVMTFSVTAYVAYALYVRDNPITVEPTEPTAQTETVQ